MTGMVLIRKASVCGGGGGRVKKSSTSCDDEQENQVSIVALLVSAIKKSIMASCRVEQDQRLTSSTAFHQMEIGWPANVQHLSHVTFDRFHGFLGLPLELQLQIPSRVPSASVSVFGVSAKSMQCSYDTRGNSVPTILLLMQERLYTQKGLKAEGIFRINPENSKEETVRDLLNRGVVPRDIDVHCLAGLIKAWFRELPSGVLDGLSPEEVLHCNAEEKSVELVKQLQPTNSALLNWAIDLMADVVEQEAFNKMNARNIAMVFAPNMTQMSDPLTALMHAVQVMNLLKALIIKTLREREETTTRGCSPMSYRSSNIHTDDEVKSQHGMNTSCELGRLLQAEGNAQANYSPTRESEVESFGEIEESFPRHLNVIETTNNSFREFDRSLHMESFKIGSTLIAASGISEFDRRIIISSGLSTSDEEDSGLR